MSDRDIIMQRIVERAVSLFSADNAGDPNKGGLFTTAHYGQAMKAEFKTPGPTLDSETCAKHLSQMGDIVERAGGNIWRCRRLGSGPIQSDASETIGVEIDESEAESLTSGQLELRARFEVGLRSAVLRVLSGGGNVNFSSTMWWSIEGMSDALKNNDLVWDGHLENLVGLALYSMAVDGKVVSQPNMLVDGARVTVFALVPKSAGSQPSFEGSPDDPGENFGNI